VIDVRTQHPTWCDRGRCTANGTRSGVHRSLSAMVDGTDIEAFLYMVASHPDDVFIDVRCEGLLTPAQAFNLGKVLTSLGKAALGVAKPRGRSALRG
jgi:hypothetical protein